ncbi:hypothetical protein JHK87_049683 [Glycine soja]|nr:hypothetical protein JHK87_049683 [Glycine soja]
MRPTVRGEIIQVGSRESYDELKRSLAACCLCQRGTTRSMMSSREVASPGEVRKVGFSKRCMFGGGNGSNSSNATTGASLGEGDGGNVELVGDVGGSSNDLVVDAFDLDNLILVEPNDDAQSKEDLDDDGDGDESDDIHGDDPIRGLDMIL